MTKSFLMCALICTMFGGQVMADSRSHTENFNGVDITFSPPNMPEQRTFRLRGFLSKRETEILVPVIPLIAKFLNHVRRKDSLIFSDKVNEPRKPYQFIEESNVWLAPYITNNWIVREDNISFVTDFIVNYGRIETGDSMMGEYFFRDAYVFKKINGKWVFYENYGEKPYGFLKCKHADKNCKLDPPLW
jgi:hypothetical protein